jgi:transcription regulator MmyB-like protein
VSVELTMLAGLSVECYARLERGNLRGVSKAVLDALTAPALVSNARMDYLAANRPRRALYAPLFDSPVGTNAARFLLLDPRGPEFYPDWDQAVDDVVALMRTEAGRSPFDKVLTDLIGELSTRSGVFREQWARHDVRLHLTGTKRLRDPSWATSTCGSRPWRCPPIPASRCCSTPPSPARRPSRH